MLLQKRDLIEEVLNAQPDISVKQILEEKAKANYTTIRSLYAMQAFSDMIELHQWLRAKKG
jgi:hypothetical protein